MENDFHVGRLIERVLKEKGKSKKWLGEELDYGKNWAVELTKKFSIPTAMLLRVGDVLGYNFFEELGRQFDCMFPTSGARGPTQITARLSLAEGASLTEAIQYLETHLLPNPDENQASHPLVLTRFSVLLGDMAVGVRGRDADDHRNPKGD